MINELERRMKSLAGITDGARRYSDDQPRDDDGKWTSGGGDSKEGKSSIKSGSDVSHEQLKSWQSDVSSQLQPEIDDKKRGALAFMDSTIKKQLSNPGPSWRFAYSTDEDGKVVAAGALHVADSLTAGNDDTIHGRMGVISYLGSIKSGEGAKVVGSLEKQASSMGLSKIALEASDLNASFYSRLGYVGRGDPDEMGFIMTKKI